MLCRAYYAFTLLFFFPPISHIFLKVCCLTICPLRCYLFVYLVEENNNEGVSKCTHPLFMHKAPTFSSQGFAIS